MNDFEGIIKRMTVTRLEPGDYASQINTCKKKAEREAERGEHYYRQRKCAVCGKLFWPTHSQQTLCSDKCRKEKHNQVTLKAYHDKKAKENAQWNASSKTKEQVSSTSLSGTIFAPALLPQPARTSAE